MNIEDLLAIHNLLGRYAHVMDTGSRSLAPWEDLRLIFTDDAVFDFTEAGGGRAEGADAIIAVTATGNHPSGHHFTNPVIDAVGPDEVMSRIKLLSIERNGLANSGHYVDRIVRKAHGWRIQDRKAVVYFADPAAT